MCTCIYVSGENKEHPKEWFIAYIFNTQLELLPIMKMAVVNLVMKKLIKLCGEQTSVPGFFFYIAISKGISLINYFPN